MTNALKVGDRAKVYTLPLSFKGTVTKIEGCKVWVTEEGLYSGHDDNPFHIKQCRKLSKKITDKGTTMQKNCMHDANYRCPSCSTYTVKSNKEAELTELKLEVGKKYDADKGGLFIIIANLNDYGIKTSFPFVGYHYDKVYHFGISGNGFPCEYQNSFTKQTLTLIKEHREPYKHNKTYYFVFNKNESPWYDTLDCITDKSTNCILYDSKEEAMSSTTERYAHVGKLEITAIITEE